jgi:RNA polymerase sigma-70 factor, ECF subfamily
MTDQTSDSESPLPDDFVLRARSDRAAFAVLFDRYYPRVLKYCLRRMGDRAAAEDVASEVFLSVASHIRGFAGRTETDFRRWLFRIATNAVVAQRRQAGRRQAILKTAAGQGRFGGDVEERSAPADHEILDWPTIHAAIQELDDREQTIVTLRFFAGLSHEEIAGIVDSTAGAVRTALSRTLTQLRARFAPARGDG